MLCALQKISDLRGSLGSGKDQGMVDPPFEGGAYVSAPALLSQSQTSPFHLPSQWATGANPCNSNEYLVPLFWLCRCYRGWHKTCCTGTCTLSSG